MITNKTVLVKKVEIKEATIILREDGILQVNYKKGTHLDVELQLRILDIFIELCNGKDHPFLFTAMDYVTISREAQDNAIKLDPKYPSLASAVVADNLAYRLIANFYLRVKKPKKPFKVFDNETEATEWLKTFL